MRTRSDIYNWKTFSHCQKPSCEIRTQNPFVLLQKKTPVGFKSNQLKQTECICPLVTWLLFAPPPPPLLNFIHTPKSVIGESSLARETKWGSAKESQSKNKDPPQRLVRGKQEEATDEGWFSRVPCVLTQVSTHKIRGTLEEGQKHYYAHIMHTHKKATTTKKTTVILSQSHQNCQMFHDLSLFWCKIFF